MMELRIFSHLGYTYTPYIAVKSFFSLFSSFDSNGGNKLETGKTKAGLRHIYERVYNNDVFVESNTWWNNEPF